MKSVPLLPHYILILIFVVSACSSPSPTASMPTKENIPTPVAPSSPVSAPSLAVPSVVATPMNTPLVTGRATVTPPICWFGACDLTPTPTLQAAECTFTQPRTGIWQIASHMGEIALKLTRAKTEIAMTIPGGKMYCIELPVGEYVWEVKANHYPQYKPIDGKFTIEEKKIWGSVSICIPRDPDTRQILTIECGGGATVPTPGGVQPGNTGQ